MLDLKFIVNIMLQYIYRENILGTFSSVTKAYTNPISCRSPMLQIQNILGGLTKPLKIKLVQSVSFSTYEGFKIT